MTGRKIASLDQKIHTFICIANSVRRRKVDERRAGAGSFETLALELFEYQFLRNRMYQKFCRLRGAGPENVKEWRRMPAMPVLGFKELALRAFPSKLTKKTFETSGTTVGKKGVHYFDSVRLYEKSSISAFRMFCLPDRARLSYYFLLASPRLIPHSSLSHMAGTLDRNLCGDRAGYYVRGGVMQFKTLTRDLESDQKPVLLFTTALGLSAYLDYLKMNGVALQLKPASRLVETGGSKGRSKEISKPQLYAGCEKWLGIPKARCLSEYGMTELSSQFYSSALVDRMKGLRRKPVMLGPAWTRTLVIDPKTGCEAKKGRPGLLRHFDLANRGSVMAVQTEDIGRARDEGFDLLGRLSGSELRGCSLTYEDFNLHGHV